MVAIFLAGGGDHYGAWSLFVCCVLSDHIVVVLFCCLYSMYVLRYMCCVFCYLYLIMLLYVGRHSSSRSNKCRSSSRRTLAKYVEESATNWRA